MTVGELIEKLKKFPPHSEIHLANDEWSSEIKTIEEVATVEVPRLNSGEEDATRDIVVIFPTDKIIEQQ